MRRPLPRDMNIEAAEYQVADMEGNYIRGSMVKRFELTKLGYSSSALS